VATSVSAAARSHLHWALTDGVGPLVFARLLEHFGSAEKALGVSASSLMAVSRVGRASADKIAASRDSADVEAEIERAQNAGVSILCCADKDYPENLRRIPDPPIVLYVKGALARSDVVSISVVGARRCTMYGSEQARRFGELLAGAGFTVVSGLARGIDAFAHHGAVDARGRSIAVLGNGLSEIYPPENASLAEKLAENGAYISALPMTTPVRAANFPARNRIIAGLTLGTLVIEAAHRSGALITARLAAEYNREVFALPGLVCEPMAFGTNALIRDSSAKLVTGLDDVLDELGDVGSLLGEGRERPEPPKPPRSQPPREPPPQDSGPTPGLSNAEELVYAAVPHMPVFQDTILTKTGVAPGEALAAFTSLELKGLIKRLPGQMVTRARRS
jgi:DNA processing protein